MKVVSFVSGIALGMAAATAAMSVVYPDVPKRMMRDSKHVIKAVKRAI